MDLESDQSYPMQMAEIQMGGSLQISINQLSLGEGRYPFLLLEGASEAAMVFPRHLIK
jgi:hypothetical protein